MKATKITGLEAYDVLADLLVPIEELSHNDEVMAEFKEKNYLKALIIALRTNKKEINTILAVLDGQDPETFEPNVFTLPKQLVSLANDPDVISLFQFSSLDAAAPSGDATEITEEEET